MKILITALGPHPNEGGVDTYVRTLMSILGARGHTIGFINYADLGILPDDRLASFRQVAHLVVEKLNDKVPETFIGFEVYKHGLEHILDYFDASSYDIIHSQHGITSYVAKKLYPQIPLIGTIHGCVYSEVISGGIVQSSTEAEIFRRYDQYAVENPTTVVTVSSYLTKELPPILEGAHEIINNGVNIDVFKPRPDRNNPTVKIATAGSLSYLKGYDVLMHSLTLLKRENYEFELTVFGDGPDRMKLQNIVEANRLPVDFRGAVSREQLAKELPYFDIFVQPSRLENFPFSIIEAMACGCTPVGTAVGDVPDQIGHMKNGVLCPPENVYELFKALEMLIRNKNIREEMGKYSREKAVNQFSLEKMAIRFEEVYQKTIEKHHSNRHICGLPS